MENNVRFTSAAAVALAAAGLLAGAAACSSAPPVHHHHHAISAAGRSFKDGMAAGKHSVSSATETDKQLKAECVALEVSDLPPGGSKSSFMGGCFAGQILALAALDKSGGN
jgi:hypothetical protein